MLMIFQSPHLIVCYSRGATSPHQLCWPAFIVSADLNILTSLMANTNQQAALHSNCFRWPKMLVESRLLTSGLKIAAIFPQCSRWKTEKNSYQRPSKTTTNLKLWPWKCLEGANSWNKGFPFLHESLTKQQYKKDKTFITFLNSVEKHKESVLFPSGKAVERTVFHNL